jgi:hypothetical protein
MKMGKAGRKNKGVPSSGPNPAKTRAVQDLRRSSAASKHADRRTRRLRSREAARDAAVEEEN